MAPQLASLAALLFFLESSLVQRGFLNFFPSAEVVKPWKEFLAWSDFLLNLALNCFLKPVLLPSLFPQLFLAFVSSPTWGFLPGKTFLGWKGFLLGWWGLFWWPWLGPLVGLGFLTARFTRTLRPHTCKGDNNLTMIGIDKLNQYYLSKILHSIQKKQL